MDVVFYSHREPFIVLKNHLKDVAGRMVKKHREKKDFIKLPVDDEFLRIVGIAHDFGKYTTYFQNYIKNGISDSKDRHFHGFISALFGAWLSPKRDYLPVVAYLAIKHHHGNLKNLSDDLSENKNFENLKIAEEQIKDLEENKEKISEELRVDITDFLKSWRDVWKELNDYVFELEEFADNEKKLEVYFMLLYTYSLLIDSDKKSAARAEEVKRKELPKDIIEQYRKVKRWDKPKKEIDKLRNEIYYEVMEKVENLREIPDISTITAPTGIGKTFLNLDVALRYREKLGGKPRIIYALPFISIIDQTYKVFDGILSEILGREYEENKGVYLIQHHHLAQAEYKKEDENRPVGEALLLIESWNSEIVITTFVQLLHSIIAFQNCFLKKFHNIAGSIIILDEVQAINHDYWNAIGLILEKLPEYLGCKIILSTATRPLIVSKYTELVENQDKYFRSPILKRTKLVPRFEEELSVEEFADKFMDSIEKDKSSYLVVFNTIRSSIEFYEEIKRKIEKDYKIFYLSTNVIPLQREERIEKIKELLGKGEKVILVSTQVVEAGVDLDFDKVYRDLGPLDSLIQIAGRCNRNKRFGLGEEEIFILKCEECRYKYFSKRIYGSTLIDITRIILDKEYEEDKYKELSEKYFSLVKENKSQDKSKKVMEDIYKLRFHADDNCIACDFKLIEELPTIDVFVEIDETAKEVYEEFEEKVLNEKNFIKRIENYHKIKSVFNRHIISIENKVFKNIYTEGKFPKIPLEFVEDYYDKKGYGLKLLNIDRSYLVY